MKFLLSVIVACVTPHLFHAHPLCMDTSTPSEDKRNQMQFCTEIINPSNKDGACCTLQEEIQQKAMYFDPYILSEQCLPYQRQVACGRCHPYSVHLLSDGGDIIRLSSDFCQKYFNACKVDMALPDNFCDIHAAQSYYAYPMVSAASTVTTDLIPYFPNLAGLLPTQMIGMFMRPDINSWWIINQSGRITEVENNSATGNLITILDISAIVTSSSEMGLIGFTFSPDFSTTFRFYVNYISNNRKTIIARYTYITGDAIGTANSQVILLQFDQPYENHNGGTLLFSPSDLARPTGATFYDLFIATGDGGGLNNPGNTSQDLNSLLGKILRIRISTDYNRSNYEIPGDNINREVWAYGLRNPWKCTFDKNKLDIPEMWCGDVGENSIEKIIIVQPGKNHGWKNFEGTKHNFGNVIDFVQPEYEYCHVGYTGAMCAGKPFTGESITGGYVYRGANYAASLRGQYIFADFQSSRIVRIFKENGVWQGAVIVESTGWSIASLAEDNDGELYILRYGENSSIYALPAIGQEMVPVLNPDPTCQRGILNDTGDVCCSTACGICGGVGCDMRQGGPITCCSSTILLSKKFCTNSEAPCKMDINPQRRNLIEYEVDAFMEGN